MIRAGPLALGAALLALVCLAATASADETLVLRGQAAQLSIATGGGGLIEFRFNDQQINPINWEITNDLEERAPSEPHLRGHFICLDRWGAPSEAELARGIPFHGEAPRIVWQVSELPKNQDGKIVAEMGCVMPLAGMKVKRQVRLDEHDAYLTVTEAITNTRKLGRVFNAVQHPTIAPPFLDESTLVDTNAQHGFVQEEPIPASAESAGSWPNLTIAGRRVDLRRFTNAAESVTRSDVTSFVFDRRAEYGWVTACNPGQQLLMGYLWKTEDYPWLNIWRHIDKGRVTARGLEFGTTGLHQPFGELVRTGTILDRPLLEYIDAGQTVQKSYAMFMLKTPPDYQGVADASYTDGRLNFTERRKRNSRTLTLVVGNLLGD